MAIHANRSVIAVAAYAVVIIVRILLIRVRRIHARVTCIDTREDRIIRGINMAIGADRIVVWYLEVRVAEDRAEPGGGHPGGVTGCAGSGVRRSDVVRNV